MNCVLDFAAFEGDARVATSNANDLFYAMLAVTEVIDDINASCNHLATGTDVSRVNVNCGQWVDVSSTFLDALSAGLEAAEITNGAIDPTVARTWECVELDSKHRRVRIPKDVSLNLIGTARAFACDLAAQRAASVCSGSVLVNFGGDISIAGSTNNAGWPIGIGAEPSGGALDQVVDLKGGGISTASVLRDHQTSNGSQLHHIIDPRNGLPAETPWTLVSVAAGNCLDANTASTASIIKGTEAVSWLEFQGLDARLVDGAGNVTRVGRWPSTN